jgi:molecular chaperone DnaJ
MDFYALLGLGRTATAAEIERAHRRMARRYHPGVNPGDRVAEQMYRGIQEAYGVLVDAERRREYDRGGPSAARDAIRTETVVAFEGFDFSASADDARAATFSELFADVFQSAAREATAPSRGADLELTVQLSFVAAARGTEFPVSLTRQERCGSCAGAGLIEHHARACEACGGAGVRRWARGHMVFTKPCEPCGGGGRLATVPCRTCHGAGVHTRTEVLTLTVPAGVTGGSRMAVPGRGHAGARGGPAGDLYVNIEVAAHPFFRRIGNDLHVTVPVAVHEAALGADIRVPTLEGPAVLHVPPGTVSGARLHLEGAGIVDPSSRAAGDVVVDVQLVLPSEMDAQSKELLRAFGARNRADVRERFFSAD